MRITDTTSWEATRHARRLRSVTLKVFPNLRSENIGGIVSLLGSLLFMLGGDVQSLLIVCVFLTAELILVHRGHLPWGYSAGSFLFFIGNILSAQASIVGQNIALKFSLYAMAIIWLLGAARAPVIELSNVYQSKILNRSAYSLQQIVGLIIIWIRIPGFIAALFGGNVLVATSIACWALSDLLIGRLSSIRKFFYLRRL